MGSSVSKLPSILLRRPHCRRCQPRHLRLDAPPQAVPGPSKLWPDAALVLVTAAVGRALVATFDSNASTRSGAILPAASMVCADGTSAAPVHCAALHRGQRQRRSRVYEIANKFFFDI